MKASAVVPDLGPQIGVTIFRCPYCAKTWPRGGKKEGFVKSGAYSHVTGCRDILLWLMGYVLDRSAADRATPVADVALEVWFHRFRRNMLAAIASRKREGYEPRMPR